MLEHSKKEIVLQENNSENTLAIYLEDEPINYIPTKDSGYTLDITKSSCTNGVEVTFDYNTWSVKTNYSNYTYENNERVKCSLYFRKISFAEAVTTCGTLGKNASNCIQENFFLSSEIIEDETNDNNLRFIGADPENYVWFNDELWRIIGVMNNIDDGTGKKETRLKIIRNEPIGNYSWDNKGELGENDWSQSSLQTVLNEGPYWNRTSGECPYGQNGVTTTCDFSGIGLTEEAKAMISNAVWTLGGLSGEENDPNYSIEANSSTWYIYERGTEVYSGRPTEWTGQIGLMYPSDYGYATSGGSIYDRNECLENPLYNWNDIDVVLEDCYNNNWLEDGVWSWTLTPWESTSYGIYVTNNRHVDIGFVYGINYMVIPVVYLISSVKVTGGDGSSSNPFQLNF